LLAVIARLSPVQAPLRLAIAQTVRRNEHSSLSRIKSLNYGDNLLARRETALRGMDDALMLNVRGDIACATIGNIFLRIDGCWRTPPVAAGALPGLARRRLLSMLDAQEKPIACADLTRTDMGFRCNSLGLSRIREIEGRRLLNATPVAEKLRLFD
jgi:branched-chain amino acid aminotransferase